MSLKDVYDKLDAIEGGKELIESIKNEVQSISKESAGNRVTAKEANTELVGIKEQLSEMASMVTKLGEASGSAIDLGDVSDSLAGKRIAKELEALTGQVTTLRQERDNEMKSKFELERNNVLTKELSKHGIADDFREDLVNTISSRYQKDEQGQWVKDDGTTLASDVETTIAGKDHLKANTIPSGSGIKKPSGNVQKASDFTTASTFEEKWDAIKNKS